MSNINNSKIEIEEVESANKLYLLFGMVYAILFVILEFVSIREFFVSSNTGEALGIFAVVQLPGIIALVGANVLINSYIHRKKFNLYCCNLENGIDIEYIKDFELFHKQWLYINLYLLFLNYFSLIVHLKQYLKNSHLQNIDLKSYMHFLLP